MDADSAGNTTPVAGQDGALQGKTNFEVSPQNDEVINRRSANCADCEFCATTGCSLGRRGMGGSLYLRIYRSPAGAIVSRVGRVPLTCSRAVLNFFR